MSGASEVTCARGCLHPAFLFTQDTAFRTLLVVFRYLGNTFRLEYFLLYLNWISHYLVLSITNTFLNLRKCLSPEQSTEQGIVSLEGTAEPIPNFEASDQTQERKQARAKRSLRMPTEDHMDSLKYDRLYVSSSPIFFLKLFWNGTLRLELAKC